jgi:phage terminase large subunit
MEGGVIRNLERMNYTNLYMREQQDELTHQIQKKFGWRTTETSRRLIISDLIEYVRDHTNLINCINTIDEMLCFVRNEKGKPVAQEGKHDDLVMSYAIALQAALSGQQKRASMEKEIDWDKVDKLEDDAREDFYNMSPEDQKRKATEWRLWK